MKNENEFRKDGKLFIKEIKSCSCFEKSGNEYVLLCSIHQRGRHHYIYTENADCLTRYNKNLWLTDTAKEAANKAIFDFENAIKEIKTDGIECDSLTVYLRKMPLHKYDCLYEFTDNKGEKRIRYIKNENIDIIIFNLKIDSSIPFDSDLVELISNPTKETIGNNPLYKAAVKNNDKYLKHRLLVYYHLATKEECTVLSKLLGLRVLPALSEEYNKSYIIDSDTVDISLISRSGYTILHRPYFAMKDSTHSKIQLNPHTKIGVDAAKVYDESIPFCEFLKLFDD